MGVKHGHKLSYSLNGLSLMRLHLIAKSRFVRVKGNNSVKRMQQPTIDVDISWLYRSKNNIVEDNSISHVMDICLEFAKIGFIVVLVCDGRQRHHSKHATIERYAKMFRSSIKNDVSRTKLARLCRQRIESDSVEEKATLFEQEKVLAAEIKQYEKPEQSEKRASNNANDSDHDNNSHHSDIVTVSERSSTGSMSNPIVPPGGMKDSDFRAQVKAEEEKVMAEFGLLSQTSPPSVEGSSSHRSFNILMIGDIQESFSDEVSLLGGQAGRWTEGKQQSITQVANDSATSLLHGSNIIPESDNSSSSALQSSTANSKTLVKGGWIPPPSETSDAATSDAATSDGERATKIDDKPSEDRTHQISEIRTDKQSDEDDDDEKYNSYPVMGISPLAIAKIPSSVNAPTSSLLPNQGSLDTDDDYDGDDSETKEAQRRKVTDKRNSIFLKKT